MPPSRTHSRPSRKIATNSDVPKTRRPIVISNITPLVDCGRYPVKRIVGDALHLNADIIKSGHDSLYVVVYYRLQGTVEWEPSQMSYDYNNDRWSGSFPLSAVGTYEYFIEAWTDRFATLLGAIEEWQRAGEDVSADVDEFKELLTGALSIASQDDANVISAVLNEINKLDVSSLVKKLRDSSVSGIVNRRAEKGDAISSAVFMVIVDPPKARFSTWYEMFPRSQGTIPGRSATFADCERRLDELKQMGFDVVYLPPIHPIGITNRRGPNNTEGRPGDPGSPWAIGNANGGHDAVNEDLGAIEDFRHFVSAAKEKDMDVALDIAFQCSPDHPYVKSHPEWFRRRSDGTMRYAENPPKKYFDIYPLDFNSKNWRDLWEELARVVLFWAENGVRFFRVDNPHTKPVDFWEWLIKKVKMKYPNTIFLSEAFTRPKSMKLLAKVGFSQSYTYFTWKNTKYELIDLINEFVLSDVSEYYRGNFFTNTPDILHEYLQRGGRPAFKIRLVLAATLASAYGIYNGFELCENVAKAPDSEEYADSEKYQYKVWNWDRPGNIREYIANVNTIRRDNPALQDTKNLRILNSDSEYVIFYAKWTQDKSNIVLVAVNLDPSSVHDSKVQVPLDELGLGQQDDYMLRDLITGKEFHWRGDTNYVRLDPSVEPAHVFLMVKR